MKNIFRLLNQSIDIYDSYERYSQYRYEITEQLLQICLKNNYGSVVFFGVGNGLDVNYQELLHHGIHLTLTDIDELSMIRGLEYVGLESKDYTLVAFDYLGNVEGCIEGFVSQLLKYDGTQSSSSYKRLDAHEVEKIVNQFTNDLEQVMKEHKFIEMLGQSYDLVVVLPIYTQLLFVDVIHRLESKGIETTLIKAHLLQKMIVIIDSFNRKLLEICQPHGGIYILSDIMEVRNQKGRKAETSDEIMANIHQYESEYGVGLGSYGLLNMEEYGLVSDAYGYFWNFDEQRGFYVKGELFKPKV